MTQEDTETFAQQLQQAVDRGQVVLIQPTAPRPAAPLARDRDAASQAAALCLTFELRHAESRMLARLLAYDYCTKDELRAAAPGDKEAIAPGSIDVYLSSLRKKLARHDIRVSTIPTLGYGLDRKARDKINKLLAEYDATTSGAEACVP